MLTDLRAAQLCQAVYAGQSGFDHWFEADGIIAGLVRQNDDVTIVFRGTDCAEDWLRDLDAVPVETLRLGTVHAGFYAGMDLFLSEVGMYLTGHVAVTGHSLGAARAAILAGLMTAGGHPPAKLTLFGCPRPGGGLLADIVTHGSTVIASYRNREDPVPEVPYLPGVYQHIVDPTPIQSPDWHLVNVEDHYIAEYVAALQTTVARSCEAVSG